MAYLDHAASTPMREAAVAAMEPFLTHHAANPSGGHRASQAAKNALEEARERVAALLGATPAEIVFTGGGSEGDNLAVKGAAWAAADRGDADGVVTTGIEHKAVLGAAHRLERNGARATFVPATIAGTVDLDHLADALDARTAVVSVMLVNNETGIVQPLDDVAALVRECAPRAALHTDAVQAPQWLDVGAAAAVADLVVVSGHKFGGPKGVGALVRRRDVALVPLVEGGGHEWGLRAGTQNVAGIVAFATALAETHANRETEIARITMLRDRLDAGLRAAVPDMVVNGDPARRVGGLLHVAFPGVEAETLLVALDQLGIEAASGSACSSGAIDPSHVLVAMGLDADLARASVRFSLGYASTAADVDAALDAVPRAVASLRAASTV
ncbi:MAG TPA: cysteine desulfurase family protein [Acidimicrobiia bacterium]|jgi:cysteine desulfurase|nr:cysteine desulfurase family protein [Acidimicrobiia bacterium]